MPRGTRPRPAESGEGSPRVPPSAGPAAEASGRTHVEPLAPQAAAPPRPSRTGRVELDDAIASLVEAAGPRDPDLLAQMLTTAIRLSSQANRGELKLASASLQEFARSFRLFAKYRDRPKVTIFGSARVASGDFAYRVTAAFAQAIVQRGWMVITGAGPGIMAAGNEGAGPASSFGANITLPALNQTNLYIANDSKLIHFRYFFTRKVTFVKESDAFVMLPGGFGTLDEAFELLTLMQTGKTAIRPVVLLEPPGSTYWQDWESFLNDQLVERGFISPQDLALVRVATSAEDAVAEIERFYTNYHSMRFVGQRLHVRLRAAPGAAALDRLHAEFGDLLAKGRFEVVRPAPAEVTEADALDYARLAFYPSHDYGRLRLLIDALNQPD